MLSQENNEQAQLYELHAFDLTKAPPPSIKHQSIIMI